MELNEALKKFVNPSMDGNSKFSLIYITELIKSIIFKEKDYLEDGILLPVN
jgi:hypothetical protein